MGFNFLRCLFSEPEIHVKRATAFFGLESEQIKIPFKYNQYAIQTTSVERKRNSEKLSWENDPHLIEADQKTLKSRKINFWPS